MKSYKLKNNLKPENKKCQGCGIILTSQPKKIGYTPVIDKAKLCQRCFKLKYYNQNFEDISLNLEQHVTDVLKKFDYSKKAVFYICPPSQISFKKQEIESIKNKAKKFYLVISQIDSLINIKKLNLTKYKILNLINEANININEKEIILTSVYLNLNYTELKYAIEDSFKNKLKVVFCGPTNAGKSSIINWIIRREKMTNLEMLTTSYYKNTTQDIKQLKLDKNKHLIDLPGFPDFNSFQSIMSNEQLKKFFGKNAKWKNKIFQVKNDRYFIFENLFVLEIYVDKKASKFTSNIITYFNDNLNVHVANLKNKEYLQKNDKNNEIFFKKNIKKYEFKLLDNYNLLVLNKLGFVVLKNISKIILWIPENITEPKLIKSAKL